MEALRVPGDLTAAWGALAPAVRGYLGKFLSIAGPQGIPVAPVAAPFPGFHDDLAAGAPRLVAAFPDLVRTVVAIEPGEAADRVEVRIACEGAHDGPFFDFMLATGRAVRFVETHQLRVAGGRIVEDAIAIDLRAIIRQLATANRG